MLFFISINLNEGMSTRSMINEFIEMCVCEIKMEKNRKKIESDVIEPLIDCILEKIKPYIIGTSIFFITIILLIICILVLTVLPKT